MLPAHFAWPTYKGTTWDDITASRPLAFIGQINLTDAAPFDTEKNLPDHGILALFYDLKTMKWGYAPEDRGCVRVYWFEDTETLVETIPPSEITDFNGESISIPIYSITFSRCNTPDSSEDPSRIHKLLGTPDTIQGEFFSECELVDRGYYLGNGDYRNAMSDAAYNDALAHSKDWMLLMQLGTIGAYPDFELMWGDMGCVYICIRCEDLAARCFDNVWLILQC